MQKVKPSPANQILTVTRFELLRYLREKKLYAAIGISILISSLLVVIPAVYDFGFASNVNDYFSMPVGFVFILIIACAAFFGSNALLIDFHSKTGYTLFTNPIERKSIWAGKFLAAESISVMIIGIYYLIVAGGALYNFQTLSFEILQSAAFSFVTLTAIMSITFLISAVFRGPTGAAVLVFMLFFFILPVVDFVVMLASDVDVAWYSIVFSSKIIGNALVSEETLAIQELMIPMMGGGNNPDILQSLGIFGIYIITSISASIFFYQRKEMIEK